MKFLIYLLCIPLALLPFSLPASATAPVSDTSTSPSVSSYIIQALTESQESIDLSNYQIERSVAVKLYCDIRLNHPELFYVAPEISYTYTQSSLILTIEPSYTLSNEDLVVAQQHYEDWIFDFLSQANQAIIHPTDIEKILYIHDYIGSNYTYSPQGKEIYDVYGLISQGHGVCQALSLGMIALGRAWGLEMDMVISDEMDHAWCHVSIDECYYHIDITRDLPMDNSPLDHEKCILSDDGMKALGYVGYTCMGGHTCTDVAFENERHTSLFAPWQGELLPLGGGWLGVHKTYGIGYLHIHEGRDIEFRGNDADGNGQMTLTDLWLPEISHYTENPTIKAWQEKTRQEIIKAGFERYPSKGVDTKIDALTYMRGGVRKGAPYPIASLAASRATSTSSHTRNNT